MRELNIAECIEGNHHANNKKLLVAAVVAMVVWALVREALRSKKSVEEKDIEATVTEKVNPIIEELSDWEVEHHLKENKNYGVRRKFLESILDIFLWSKR